MKQNKSFLLREIAGIPYLLPFGQMIADHRRGLKTNSTGIYLWNLLEEEHSMEEILALSAEYYEVSEEELPKFREEITHFVTQLLTHKILVDNSSAKKISGQAEQLLSIGGLTLQLTGPKAAFPPAFSDFIVPASEQTDQRIFIYPEQPAIHSNGQVLLRNDELVIMEQEEQYVLLFPAIKQIIEIQLKKDASAAHCYCLPPFNEAFHADLFHAIRLLYLYLAQKHDMVALHSASILYKEKLWLFSGPSHMGKSTHTKLWEELYHTPIINGDLNLLAVENGKPVVHGIPWCGTSDIYTTKTYPLGGIILLNKAPENSFEHLTPDKKQLLIAQRVISPIWTREQMHRNLDIIAQLAKHIFICKLHCTKESEAAEFMRKEIDLFLSGL